MHNAAPGTGLCITGTMAEIRALSLAEQRLHLEAHPQQVGRVDHVVLVEGTHRTTVQHWPTATKVVGVPLTGALGRTLGMQLSILTGKVTRFKLALLAARWPEVLWMFVPEVVDYYRHEMLPMGGNHQLQLTGSVLGHVRWGISQQRCRDKVNSDPYHLRCLLNQFVSPAGPPVALHWLWF